VHKPLLATQNTQKLYVHTYIESYAMKNCGAKINLYYEVGAIPLALFPHMFVLLHHRNIINRRRISSRNGRFPLSSKASSK
jgi:hypothetical protein